MLDVSGFLYLLTNRAFPGYVKIGYTRGSPFDRAMELYTTGVPEPFLVHRAWYVFDAESTERTVHSALADKRSAQGAREFFALTVVDAIEIIERLIVRDLVPEIYEGSGSHLEFLKEVVAEKEALAAQHAAVSDQCATLERSKNALKAQLQALSDKLARYEEANEKICMVDKIILERNECRDRYRAAVTAVQAWAQEYERYLISLGGRFARFAEEHAKNRPRV